MYLNEAVIRELEQQYGVPECGTARAAFEARAFALLEYCRRKDRAHDVTLMIRGADERFAVIRKPSYPPGVFRPPSGGVEPGEAFELGAAREAWEETGLEIRLDRYLLRVEARFTCNGSEAPWTTHVFLATALGGKIEPQDRVEIEEARWASVAEIVGEFRPAMLRIGSAGMRYRVDLQDDALRLLGLMAPPAPEPGRIIIPTPAAQGAAIR